MKDLFTKAERRRHALIRCWANYGLLALFQFIRLRRLSDRHPDADVRNHGEHPEMVGYLRSRLEDLGEAGSPLHQQAKSFCRRAYA